MTTRIFTYEAPDIVEVEGMRRWAWGERIVWCVLVVDGEIVGRRRTCDELAELILR